MLPLVAKLLAGGTANVAGNVAATTAAGSWIQHELENTSGMLPGEMMMMKLKMGVNPFLPVKVRPGLGNAYYTEGPPEHIAYDPTFGKPGILAHELGHKLIYDGKAGVIMKFLQDKLYAPSRALSSTAALPVTLYNVRKFGRMGNPLSGAAIGAGTSGLAGAGHLLPEWKASALAKEHYLSDRFNESQNNTLLNAALTTYLADQMAGPAALGALTSVENSKFLPKLLRTTKEDALIAPGMLKRLTKLFQRFK